MKSNAIYMLGLLFVIFTASCGESLEDTYDEFTGDGMIRYVGRCTDVQVNSGWERLQVIWRNHTEAGIERVKITWQSENETVPQVRYIERANLHVEGDLMDTVYLEGLGNSVYAVRVSNVVADNSESLIEEKFGRPYTFDHEDLGSFTRGVSFFSRMGDKLALVLDGDNENVKELVLSYYEEGKTEASEWNIKEHMRDSLTCYESIYGIPFPKKRPDNMFLLPEGDGAKIDFSKPLVISRKGMLNGCVDTIKFKPMELSVDERLWSTEFSQLMQERFGDGWENEMNDVKTVELDYSISTLLDLLYLPRLEKVVLGRKRYMLPTFAKSFASTTDVYEGVVTLAFLNATHPVFSVEHYNNHYFTTKDCESYNASDKFKAAGYKVQLEEQASANLERRPVYETCDTTGWKVTCSDTVFNNYANNGAAWLLYDAKWKEKNMFGEEVEKEVYFEPGKTLGAGIVTVTYDMGKDHPQVVKGFKVKQPERNEKGDTDYLLSSLQIEFSNDGYTWTKATHTDGSATIGNSPGEETYIVVPDELCPAPVRYVRLTMSSRRVDSAGGVGLYSLRLGKFIPLSKLDDKSLN